MKVGFLPTNLSFSVVNGVLQSVKATLTDAGKPDLRRSKRYETDYEMLARGEKRATLIVVEKAGVFLKISHRVSCSRVTSVGRFLQKVETCVTRSYPEIC